MLELLNFVFIATAAATLLLDLNFTSALDSNKWSVISGRCSFEGSLAATTGFSRCAVSLDLPPTSQTLAGEYYASMLLTVLPTSGFVWMALGAKAVVFDMPPGSTAIGGGAVAESDGIKTTAIVHSSAASMASMLVGPTVDAATSPLLVVLHASIDTAGRLNALSLGVQTAGGSVPTLVESRIESNVVIEPSRFSLSLDNKNSPGPQVRRVRLATTLAEVLGTGEAVVPPPPTTTTIGGGTTAPASACDDLDCATCQLASASKCVWCAHVDYPAGYCTLNRCGISFARATSCATKAPPTTSAAAAVEAPSPGAAADWTPTIIGAAVGGGLFVISVIILAVAWRRGTRSGAHQTTEVATPQERQVGMYGSMASLRSADSYGQLSVAGSSNDPTPTVAQYGSPYGVGVVSSVSSYGALNVN